MQMEKDVEGQSQHEESCATFWSVAATLRGHLQSCNPIYSGLRARLLGGMRDLLAELQAWSWSCPDDHARILILKDLAKDVRRCERALRGSSSTSLEGQKQPSEGAVSAAESCGAPDGKGSRGILKLTIPAALARKRSEHAATSSCDLTDR